MVNRIDTDILKEVHEEMKKYLSMDAIMDTEFSVPWMQFLNAIELLSVPYYKPKMKLNVPICNRTGVRINTLGQNILCTFILFGGGKGNSVVIPRTPIIPLTLHFNSKWFSIPSSSALLLL